jgi:penicillin-binding protein A
MRRSHIVLAGAAAIAGAAAMLGDRDGTSAEVRGAPLETTPAAATSGTPTPPGMSLASAASVSPRAALDATAHGVEIDLDRIALAPTGDHYVAPLKDGRHAILTLDPALQAYAEKLLDQSRAPRGAIVAMAPDGRILALAGRRGERTESSRDSRNGTFDWRLAIDVWAPAASVFKLVTASALVSAGVGPSDKVCFHGGVRSVMTSNLSDHKRDSRCEDLSYGVAHSNNAILGKLAFQKLDPPTLIQAAHALGVAQGLPGSELHGIAGTIDIPGQRDLEFAKIAAGFSGSRLSAVGGALLAATFADDGEQPVPRLIASIDGVVPTVPAPRRAVTAEVARAVAQMMLATCEAGSAARSFGRRQPIRVAGKTGTLTRTDPFYMEHSWFVGYAPVEQPRIIVSVILGNPERWHLRGHEAARRLIDRALGRASEPPAKRPRGRARGRTSLKT